ncbi:MAG: chitobiase/beta-hexosaminidase C-terminal domain-containing protein, partial [Candidatus Solibacter usitatus]|nr:chitobiase/beta-hexosaminidase C-terminal domain-containing protein [Candidatus Solibacter usitatus]
GRPYAQHIAYMDEMPTMKEMRRLDAEGKLTGAQRLFFQDRKPEEELYDVAEDPHEVNNLAASAEHAAVLERMRQAHLEWRRETRDLGLLPEPELHERMRPGGKWMTTATPAITLQDGKLRIACATEGSSIAYTTDGARWNLYAGEVPVAPGAKVRARACRLGYRDSAEVGA